MSACSVKPENTEDCGILAGSIGCVMGCGIPAGSIERAGVCGTLAGSVGHAWVCAILADDVEYAGDCGILTVSAKADSNANNSDLLSEKFIERVGFVA